ncbi:MAG TPA: septum site-determining protein MinC [Xanthobacteraceae bacterium]
MTRAIATRSQSSIRLRGRSFMAFVLAPVPPIAGWLAELDNWIKSSPGFFAGRPIILDVAAAPLDAAGIAELIRILEERGIRVMGLEGADIDPLGSPLPPVLKGGRATGEAPEQRPQSDERRDTPASPQRHEPSSLLIETPIRSGQSIIFPYGDVTVLGSVSSGAEVVAGGSIHVYGALRGRAMAGSMGNARARIFCNRNEAELISIDGFYRTAEEMDPGLRSRPAQCWLEDRTLKVAALD